MTVVDRFRRLLQRIEPSTTEASRYESHHRSVKGALRKAFNVDRIETIGSYKRGTNIGNSSDIDLLVVLEEHEVTRAGDLTTSTTVLKNVRKRLGEHSSYRSTEIGKDGQAVVLKFADGEVDVVPGMFKRFAGHPVYWIPDGEGGWRETSPSLHNRYILDADRRSGGKLRHVAKLIKFWRECRSPAIPLNSFHVELVLAQQGVCTVSKTYAQCVADALSTLAQRGGQGLQDPEGVSGVIQAVSTEAKRERLARSLAQSAEHAQIAVGWDAHGTLPKAYRYWNMVFNDEFPKE